MALLPPAPAIRFRSEPRFPTNESLAEFGHHIITGLHDYSDTDEDKDLSTAFTTEPLARFNQHAINRAIQDLAKESALELARSLVPRLKARFEERIPNAKPDESSRKATIEKSVPAEQLRNNDPVKQPGNDQLGNVQPGKDQPGNDNPVEKFDRNSPEEKARFETSAVRHDISADTTSSITSSDYFLSDDLLVKDVPDQAGDIKTEVAAEFQIDSVLAKRVAQLALHDFIVLADDCNSAEWSTDRISATKETVQGIFRIATTVNPQRGINLHFFDDAGLAKTPHIRADDEIKDVVSRVGFTKGAPVPCPLHEKILLPLAETINKGELHNPTIVVIIISGGRDNPEPAKNLADVISDFKDHLKHHTTSPGVFLVFLRVGDDDDAGESLDQLEQDERIRDIVCYSKEDLAHRMNLEASKSGTLTSQLVGALSQALDKGEN